MKIEIKDDVKTSTGRELDERTICRFYIRGNGFSWQKLGLIAKQCDQELCQNFVTECRAYSPEMLVFIDETGSDCRNAMRKFGCYWERLHLSRINSTRYKDFTAIATLTLDSYIATRVIACLHSNHRQWSAVMRICARSRNVSFTKTLSVFMHTTIIISNNYSTILNNSFISKQFARTHAIFENGVTN